VKIIRGAPRQLALALLALAACAFIAACGSSGSSSSSTTTAASGTPAASTTPGTTSRAKLEACLKQHGVTLPPGFGHRSGQGGGPPPGGGGGFFGGGGSGSGSAGGQTNRSRFFNSKTAAAFKACGASFGRNFRPGGRRFQLSHTKINQYVACVRKNGYSAMPNPNFSGKGPIFPASIRSNKQFQAASKKCQSILVSPPPAGSGSSSGASGGTTGA
jgi:hypothetical protein